MKIILVIPAYNEEDILLKNINDTIKVINTLNYDIKIVISDNNSKDRTAEIGKELANKYDNIDYVFVAQAGKGSAVINAWKQYSDADVYGFMDADLAVDLRHIKDALECFDYDFDVVIGSRRVKGAEVNRELYRRFTSSVLNWLINIWFKLGIKDTPCGFKFFKREVINGILDKVDDRGWVFDTEMLILAKKHNFKIKEIPVKWTEKGERDSRVKIYPTASGYIKKLLDFKKKYE